MSSLGFVRICCEWSGLINYLWVPSVEPHRHLYTYYTHTPKKQALIITKRNIETWTLWFLVMGNSKQKECCLGVGPRLGGKSIAMYIGFIDCL